MKVLCLNSRSPLAQHQPTGPGPREKDPQGLAGGRTDGPGRTLSTCWSLALILHSPDKHTSRHSRAGPDHARAAPACDHQAPHHRMLPHCTHRQTSARAGARTRARAALINRYTAHKGPAGNVPVFAAACSPCASGLRGGCVTQRSPSPPPTSFHPCAAAAAAAAAAGSVSGPSKLPPASSQAATTAGRPAARTRSCP